MKLKKFLLLAKAVCSEDNCKVGKCPFAAWDNEEHSYSGCLINEFPSDWNIKEILKRSKDAEKHLGGD